MQLKKVSGLALGLTLFLGSMTAQAAVIDVTSIASGASADTWLDGTFNNQTRNGGTLNISGAQSYDGDGSLALSGNSGSAKATALYVSQSLGSLASLSSVSYQYYRDGSSTNAANQAPSLRLYVSDGQGRVGTLVYEPVYNGVATIPVDSWELIDATAGNWWLFEGGVFENFGLDLADWATSNSFNNSTNTASKLGFGPDAQVVGIDVGIGSGWNGDSLAYVDNISLQFGTREATTWNFTTGDAQTVSEPAALGVLGLSLLGIAAAVRRRKA